MSLLLTQFRGNKITFKMRKRTKIKTTIYKVEEERKAKKKIVMTKRTVLRILLLPFMLN